MNDFNSIIKQCSSIRFGAIDIGGRADFYSSFNGEIKDLCRSLPASMQSGAMMFLMEYNRIQVGEPLEFFKNFYVPAWSVIPWAAERPGGAVPPGDMESARRAQAMAMLLHSFDDHMVEGGIPATHLTLLIRSQAWRRMIDAIDRFCAGLPGGSDIARDLINDYYSGITGKETPPDLDAYCDLFRRQMATWVVMPFLTALRSGGGDEFASGVRRSYESFGIAWRLLDDIQDLEADMADGTRSAAYVCLDVKGRSLWDEKGGNKDEICAMIRGAAVLDKIADRIVGELDSAAALADGIGLPGLGKEYRTLAGPVKEWNR